MDTTKKELEPSPLKTYLRERKWKRQCAREYFMELFEEGYVCSQKHLNRSRHLRQIFL